ncbi:MAG: dipeptidase PepE [Bacteroidetes bacterium]|nr:MAG: dipeptidase PepE [Bacteroidota bacterium]
MRLLLFSNSTNAGEAYLAYPMPYIESFLNGVKTVRFVPYAGVTFSHDEYEADVQERFSGIGTKVESVHHFDDPAGAIMEAEAIVVGGGNTWRLLELMQQKGMVDAVRQRVMAGVPYVGWSAGSNVACPTIRTTNDMPICEPKGMGAFDLIPFQINPHYLDANPDGHAGETREDRIMEFIEVNRETYVVGLREGTMLKLENGGIELVGPRPARIFLYGRVPMEVRPGVDMSFLL